jgi:CRP/FNR family transcriptional regulator, cyclic AMP receptor protein
MYLDDKGVSVDSTNPVFAACSPKSRSALLECGVLRDFDSDTLIFQKGEPAGSVMFLLDGRLQIDKTGSRGRRQVICTMTPSGCGGICLLLLGDKGLADVRALEPGQLLLVSRVDFQALAREDEKLCSAGWEGVAACVAHLSDLVEHLSFHKVAQRVAMTLVDRTEKNGDLIRLTQAGLAAEVGTTREVVARSLAGLQTAGIIRLGRGRITVMNREKLSKLI